MLSIRQTGADAALQVLAGLVDRSGPKGRPRLLAAIGHRMAFHQLPMLFRENRAGWASPASWPRAYRAGGQALIDTARLRSSWAYQTTPNNVRIGTQVFYARILDKGGVIRPRKRFLLIPLNPPLSQTECRAWPRGKEAIRSRYPGSFFLLGGDRRLGYEGPGIYRKVGQRIGSVLRSHTVTRGFGQFTVTRRSAIRAVRVERIAAARRSVRIHAHHFGQWRPGQIADCRRIAEAFLVNGTLIYGAHWSAGGRGDVGPRGGQLQ